MNWRHIIVAVFGVMLLVLLNCSPRNTEPRALTYRVFLPSVIKNADDARGVTTCILVG